MFPAELWLRLVLKEPQRWVSRNQQVKGKDKLEHDFCCRAVLLVWSKHHISLIFSQLRWPIGCLLFIYFKYFIIQLFKIFKASLQMRQRLLNVPGSWSYRPLDKNVWWALAHFCVLCFLFPPPPLSSVIGCIIQECVHICTQNSFEIESTAPFSEEISKYKFCKSCIILTLNETARDCLKKMMLCFRAQAAVIIFVLVSAPNAPQPSRFLPVLVMDDCSLL